MLSRAVLTFFIIQSITVTVLSQGPDTEVYKTVDTQYGQVRGLLKQTALGRDYLSFQGIPYMKSPLGKLRFRDPQPPEKWSQPFDATKEPPVYTHIGLISQKLEGQEDAGVINIYTPAVELKNHFPVLVWFHGGSFRVILKQFYLQTVFTTKKVNQ